MVDLLLLEQPPDNPLYKEIQLISDKLEQILEIVAHMREITRAVSPSPAEAASFPAQDQPEP
uniref:Uncharacterized protein n=1 Tax=Desulfobacca acetoxidans TaxID=60893 RepID=A0A7C3SHW7_9BACT